jgi:hypothetical protein
MARWGQCHSTSSQGGNLGFGPKRMPRFKWEQRPGTDDSRQSSLEAASLPGYKVARSAAIDV